MDDYTVQPGCSTIQCCCLNAQITVTRPSTNILEVYSNVVGQCGAATIYQNRIIYPSGFEGSLPIGTDMLEVTLSSNSHFVTTVNSRNPACNGKAAKNGAIKQHMNVGIPLVVLVLLKLTIHFVKV